MLSSAVGLGSPTSVVVRRQRHEVGPCLQRQQQGECYCYKAKYEQLCQSCHKWIREGHCIANYGAGWTHVFCEKDSQRGLPSIEQGLRRARVDNHLEEEKRQSARRCLTYGGDEEEEEESGSNRTASECETAHEYEHTDSSESEAEEEEEEESEAEADGLPSFLTEEQKRILLHEPQMGGFPICVNALAGCGKTTTIALLCEYLHKYRDPNAKILYVVFNKKNETEAMESGKFPKQNMEIRTSHAFVLRHYFGVDHMHDVKPVEDYALDDIIDTLKLRQELKSFFPNDTPAKLQHKVNSVASCIRKTIHNFQASDDYNVRVEHITYRIRFQNTALSTRTKWRAKIPVQRYVLNWAQEFFNVVVERCNNVRNGRGGRNREGGISFDGYIKVAQQQLYDLTSSFQYIIVDEAQDLTPCQASLFWSDRRRRPNRSIYLFGDKYQMLYRFRGAAHSFYDHCRVATDSKFNLTGSFRFGERIARAASMILEALHDDSNEKLMGRATNPGQLLKEGVFKNQGVVLCRTNQGIYSYLFFHQPNRWSRLDGSKTAFPSPPAWVSRLELFLALTGNNEDDPKSSNEDNTYGVGKPVFTYRHERFNTLKEIDEYIEDEGDMELLKYLSLLRFLKDQDKTLSDFVASIARSFVPLTGDPDEFNGVVLGTVHKSKGLEFSRVLIYNDYKFNIIMNSVINKKIQNDEASIFYVALSRTKDHLFLSQAAQDCLRNLAEHLGKKRLVLQEYKDMEEIRDEVDELWDIFQETKPEINELEDIPWPTGSDNDIDDDNPLALDRDMTESEQRRYIRKLRLRYHPDKFLPRYGALIVGNDLRARIVEKLQAITQACTEIVEGLQNVGEL